MLKDYINEDVKLNKNQTISIACLIVVISGVFGWIYEVIFYYFNSGMKEVYMRGGNFLPWINIYAYGAFLILFLTYRRRKHPLQVFLISMISTGILEYFSGYVLYGLLGWRRCWDYNQEILNFGNINGYVCLRSVLVFGLCGLMLIYLILPVLIKIAKKINEKKLLVFSIIICSIFVLDEIYNLFLYKLLSLPKSTEIYSKYFYFKYLYFK